MATIPTDNRAELILQQLDQLPTLPTVAVRVLELTAQDRAGARDVVRLIESDPSLTARILRIVHRAEGGLRGDINSVERAVVFLGFEAVRNAVLAVGVFETFGPSTALPAVAGGAKFDRAEFWKHCVAVACMSELLAEAGLREPVAPSDAFVAGLLHDLGKVALDAALPKSFARVVEAAAVLRGDIADVERSVVGIDHLVVGKRLAERWMLPAMFRDAMWLHGQSPAALPAACRNPTLVNLITLADAVVRRQHVGYSGNYAFPVPIEALLAAVGVTPGRLDQAAAQLVQRLEPRCRALGLGEATSDELYRQAITQANRELGRMTDQLATKNRKLAVRAKFFEALSHFHDELRPDAPPATVLFAIAQTATQALDTAAVAAFSYQASGTSAEYLVANAQHEVADRGIVETAGGVGGTPPTFGDASTGRDVGGVPPTPPESPVRPADAALEWLTSRVAPKLGGPSVYALELTIEGRAIGGIAWGATADEPTRLATQSNELVALAGGWALALRTCQIRDESRQLNEQLAEANRRLTSAQEQLMRTRTLASVGEMAAGAAHEMNNPLAVISGRSQLLAAQLSDAKHAGHARLIVEQSQRLSDMITELMEFAQPTPARVEPCSVEKMVRAAIAQAQAGGELADTSNVTIAIDDDVPAALADAGQVGAAIAELIVNARQASEASGGIEVSVAHDRYGGAIVLSVADRGHGMDERALARAFDPFFSAMPAGRRRGMGLAKALRWVEASGGQLRLESKPGEGTRASIVLKAAGVNDQIPMTNKEPMTKSQMRDAI